MADDDVKNRYLPALCRLQFGCQIEESLKILCAEEIPLQFFEEYETRRWANSYRTNPKYSEYAAKLLVKMDNLEKEKAEIEALKQSEEVVQAALPMGSETDQKIAEDAEASKDPGAPVPAKSSVVENPAASPADKKKSKGLSSRRPGLRADIKVVSPYPLVYNWNIVMYEKLYHEHSLKEYSDRLAEKGEDEMWIAFYKRLQAARIAFEKAVEDERRAKRRAEIEKAVAAARGEGGESPDVIYVSGLTPEHAASPTANLPSVRQSAPTSPGAQSIASNLPSVDARD